MDVAGVGQAGRRSAAAGALEAILGSPVQRPPTPPDGGVALGKIALFQACTPADGCELWKSDGTASGTKLVRDINGSGDSSPLC